MTFDTFYTGQEVLTRRGKRGVVVSVDGATVTVRFGGKAFPMRDTQLVSANSYDKMMRRNYAVPGQR